MFPPHQGNKVEEHVGVVCNNQCRWIPKFLLQNMNEYGRAWIPKAVTLLANPTTTTLNKPQAKSATVTRTRPRQSNFRQRSRIQMWVHKDLPHAQQIAKAKGRPRRQKATTHKHSSKCTSVKLGSPPRQLLTMCTNGY